MACLPGREKKRVRGCVFGDGQRRGRGRGEGTVKGRDIIIHRVDTKKLSGASWGEIGGGGLRKQRELKCFSGWVNTMSGACGVEGERGGGRERDEGERRGGRERDEGERRGSSGAVEFWVRVWCGAGCVRGKRRGIGPKKHAADR